MLKVYTSKWRHKWGLDRKFLAMYCAMQKQDAPHETILLGQYDISKNTEQGGFDVLLR
jgi:hypothetical protein